MTKLKEKVLELAEIAKECPENLQVVCFELLLKHHLESISPRQGKAIESSVQAPAASVPPNPPEDEKKRPIEEVVKGQDDIAESDLHIKARHFMKKCGVSIEQLNNLFYKDDGKIAPLYEDLKTTRMAEGQIRIALLQALQVRCPVESSKLQLMKSGQNLTLGSAMTRVISRPILTTMRVCSISRNTISRW